MVGWRRGEGERYVAGGRLQSDLLRVRAGIAGIGSGFEGNFGSWGSWRGVLILFANA